MNAFRQIQCRPTPRIYVTGRFFIPRIETRGELAASLASGAYSLVVIDGGDFPDDARHSLGLVAGSYYPVAVPVEPDGADVYLAAALATGAYSLVVISGGSYPGAASLSSGLRAGAYSLVIVVGGTFTEGGPLSVGLIAGAYSPA